MKIERKESGFRPVVITLENEEEVTQMRALSDADYRIPAVLCSEALGNTALEESFRLEGEAEFEKVRRFLDLLGRLLNA